jgi:hypothetical protein
MNVNACSHELEICDKIPVPGYEFPFRGERRRTMMLPQTNRNRDGIAEIRHLKLQIH